MSDIVVFGAKKFEARIKHCIDNYSDDKVVAFCVDEEYIESETFCDCPVIAFESIEKYYSPSSVRFLVGIGYKDLNSLRAEKFKAFKSKGYNGYNLIHPASFVDPSVKMGEGNIIFGNTFIDEYCSIGDSNYFGQGVSVSHNCLIGDYNYLSPRVVMGGESSIGNLNFIGLNSTIRSAITIDDQVIIGAAAYVDRSVEDGIVIVPPKSYMIEKSSKEINLLYKGNKKWKR